MRVVLVPGGLCGQSQPFVSAEETGDREPGAQEAGVSGSHSTLCPWFPQPLTLPQAGEVPTRLRRPLVGTQKSGIGQRGTELPSLTGVPHSGPPLLSLSSPVPAVTLAGLAPALRSALWCLQGLRMLLGEY